MSFDIFFIASLIGGVAFALSGFLVGVRKNLDVMGVFILSFLTANGGGILRDLFIGKTPYALTDLTGFLIVLSVFVLSTLVFRFKDASVEGRGLFVVCDSIGLAAFSLTGALAGVEAGLSVFGVTVLSFITATGGGILRDVIVNEEPSILKSDFYGSVAIIVALAVYGLHTFGLDNDFNIMAVFFVSLLIRLIAFKMRWHLPRLKF
jgi:uncharacterized membrane protein YeiH